MKTIEVRIMGLDDSGADEQKGSIRWDGDFATDPADSRLLKSILEQPIIAFGQNISADDAPEEFMQNLHRGYTGAYLRATKAESSSSEGNQKQKSLEADDSTEGTPIQRECERIETMFGKIYFPNCDELLDHPRFDSLWFKLTQHIEELGIIDQTRQGYVANLREAATLSQQAIDFMTGYVFPTYYSKEDRQNLDRQRRTAINILRSIIGKAQAAQGMKSLGFKSLDYFTKAKGEPCKQGQSAKRTGCIPKGKPTPKVKVPKPAKPVKGQSAKGQPCKQGQSPAKTGCVKKTKPTPKIKPPKIKASKLKAKTKPTPKKEKPISKPKVEEASKPESKTTDKEQAKKDIQKIKDDVLEKLKTVSDSLKDTYIWTAVSEISKIEKESGLSKTDQFDIADEIEEYALQDKKKSKPSENQFKMGEHVKIDNNDAVPQKISQQGTKECKKLTAAEEYAVVTYSGDAYASINGAMRKCPPKFECMSGKDKSIMEGVEAALAKAPPLEEPVTAYRGLSDLTPEVMSGLLKELEHCSKSGLPYMMPNIISTTLAPRIAVSEFGKSVGKTESLVFKIKAKRGLYIESISENAQEKELLQSAKTKYKVIGMADTQYSGQFKHGNPIDKTLKTVYLEEV